jgi:hypothetical protein
MELLVTAGNMEQAISPINAGCDVLFGGFENAIGTMMTNGETEICKILSVKDDGKIISPCCTVFSIHEGIQKIINGEMYALQDVCNKIPD